MESSVAGGEGMIEDGIRVISISEDGDSDEGYLGA